jgi:hypothetical protein
MERYSRAWVVAAAAAADFTYTILSDDVHGVDMTVRGDHHSIDFQLKSTAKPDDKGDHLVFDLDVRTYDLLRQSQRTGLGVLALIVVDGDCDEWLAFDEGGTRLKWTAYYLSLHGQPPVPNTATVRLAVPKANLLTMSGMKALMAESAARWAS